MKIKTRSILLLSFAVAATGFLIPFWPLELAGLAIAGLAGHPIFALVLGLLLDIAYGQPTGALGILFFPFTLFALITILARMFSKRYFLEHDDTLGV